MGNGLSHAAIGIGACAVGSIYCTEIVPSLHKFSPIQLPLFPHPAPTYSLHSPNIYVSGTPANPIVYWHKYQKANKNNKSTSNSKLLLVYFHGNGDDIGEIAPSLEQLHDRLKHSVRGGGELHTMAMEMQGYGPLGGGRVDEEQMKRNSVLFIELMKQQWHLNNQQIVVIGRSIGTGLACHLAAHYRSSLHAIILISPFSSLDCLVGELSGPLLGPVASILVAERFPNRENLRQSTSPLLLLHGRDDTLISPKHSKDLFHCSHAEPKEFFLLQGDHNSLSWTQVCQEIDEFLQLIKKVG